MDGGVWVGGGGVEEGRGGVGVGGRAEDKFDPGSSTELANPSLHSEFPVYLSNYLHDSFHTHYISSVYVKEIVDVLGARTGSSGHQCAWRMFVTQPHPIMFRRGL